MSQEAARITADIKTLTARKAECAALIDAIGAQDADVQTQRQRLAAEKQELLVCGGGVGG